mmetsp:Transcript_26741/g.68734  ORF Transcript_26741/g.68734 Transcript_26741/m.68734 type:complete len:334 (-) Transcript_26741:2524-3525(-)
MSSPPSQFDEARRTPRMTFTKAVKQVMAAQAFVNLAEEERLARLRRASTAMRDTFDSVLSIFETPSPFESSLRSVGEGAEDEDSQDSLPSNSEKSRAAMGRSRPTDEVDGGRMEEDADESGEGWVTSEEYDVKKGVIDSLSTAGHSRNEKVPPLKSRTAAPALGNGALHGSFLKRSESSKSMLNRLMESKKRMKERLVQEREKEKEEQRKKEEMKKAAAVDIEPWGSDDTFDGSIEKVTASHSKASSLAHIMIDDRSREEKLFSGVAREVLLKAIDEVVERLDLPQDSEEKFENGANLHEFMPTPQLASFELRYAQIQLAAVCPFSSFIEVLL